MTDELNIETASQRLKALWMAVAATVGGIVLFLPALFVAGFVLWGIGEPNFPPPFINAPFIWVMHFFSIAVPMGIPICIISVWATFVRKRYQRTNIWALIAFGLFVLWMPGLIHFWG